ncbi:MAG: PKD domain-containing protein [Bacteroidetes bacterium]|nr:PKD domain-containing protein [Bacteroidota bacterium]
MVNDKNISSIEDVISWLRQNGFEPDAGMLLRIYHIHNITRPTFENPDAIYHFVNSLRAVVCKNEKQQFDFDTATIQLKPFVKPIAKKNWWWWWLIPLALIVVMVILFYTSCKYCKHHAVFNDYISCCCTFPVDSVDANILSIRLTDSTVKLYNKTVHLQVKNLWTVRDSASIAFADSLCDTLILSSRVQIDEEVLLTTEAYDSTYQDSYIIYAPVKCAASFTYAIIDPVSKTVKFENTSTGDNLKYHWDFGDGTNAKDANPEHKFSQIKDTDISVSLSVANAQCSDSTMSFISFKKEINEIPTVNSPAPPAIDVNIDDYLWKDPYYRFSVTQMLISILALLAAVAFYFIFQPKFKVIKSKAAPKKASGPFYKTLHFPVDKRMYDFEEIQILIKLWRKRKQTGELKIDQRKSFEKTIRNAGMLTVVNQDSFKTPEYLLLIKSNNIRNHHYRLIVDLLSYIEKSISIDAFIYDNDIRYLTSYTSGKKYTLKDLHATHVEHRLLIWSDGNELIVPETFDLHREVQNDINAWKEKILFTPVHPQLWGNVEILLSKLFLIETASLRGLENFITDLASLDFYTVNSKAYSLMARLNCVSDYPNLDACYAQLSNATVNEDAEEKIVASFVDRLEWYYDNNPRVFQMIACCALHEFLYWDLTRKIAIDLYNDASFLTDELIVELNYLKWFREGDIPSLFRNELIKRIGANEKIIAVQSIAKVITYNLDNKKITTEQNVKSFADFNLHISLLGAQSQISNAKVDSNLKTFEPYIYTGTDTVWNELHEQAGLSFPISAKVLLKKVNVYELPKSGSTKLFIWKIKTEVEITEMEGDYFKVRLRNESQTNVSEEANNYESAAEIPAPNAESRRTSQNDENVEQGWCKKSDLLLQGETVTKEKFFHRLLNGLKYFSIKNCRMPIAVLQN